MLSAQAGNTILLMYQENGHVTRIKKDPNYSSSLLTNRIVVYSTLNLNPTNTFQAVTNSNLYDDREG